MTRKRKSRQLTPLELEIMKVLWEGGPATVQTVQDRLPGEPKLAYTTVQTMLNVLHRKGRVKRVLKGRAYEYAPAVSREITIRLALRDIINRLFGGSAESLVMSLVESRHLTPAKLAELNKLLERAARVTRAKEKTDGDN
jgi:BlaI family penicillinase repressor